MERHLLDRTASQPFPAQSEGWGGRGCPLPQKASENSSKSPHPVCDQIGSGPPLMSVLACDSPGWGGPHALLREATALSCWSLAPQPDLALVGGQARCSARLHSCQLARPARLPWQPRRMSAGPAAPASSLSGARATSGRPRGLPGRREIPQRPLGVLGLGQALTPASRGQRMTGTALGGQGDSGKLGMGAGVYRENRNKTVGAGAPGLQRPG